ncbi:hypothetical protein B0H19DRAFT_1058225 [Mycena capillaripes]|nr:hypothetical protein B0H19DRAFT_1058225 [Mycena capillaripes]
MHKLNSLFLEGKEPQIVSTPLSPVVLAYPPISAGPPISGLHFLVVLGYNTRALKAVGVEEALGIMQNTPPFPSTLRPLQVKVNAQTERARDAAGGCICIFPLSLFFGLINYPIIEFPNVHLPLALKRLRFVTTQVFARQVLGSNSNSISVTDLDVDAMAKREWKNTNERLQRSLGGHVTALGTWMGHCLVGGTPRL